jgi:hypothetical protein
MNNIARKLRDLAVEVEQQEPSKLQLWRVIFVDTKKFTVVMATSRTDAKEKAARAYPDMHVSMACRYYSFETPLFKHPWD